jgi:paraquat-inducible protein B
MTEVVQARVIRRSRQWSLVWLVPIAALLIAGYVGYQAWLTQGVQVEVVFSAATGIEPSKTKVRYKDVDIGKVVAVTLDPDMSKVRVRLALDRRLVDQLHADAQFWVVRPRVTTRTVSGLSTLFSGAYIALTPGSQGALPEQLMGLDEPPTLSGELQGRHFMLSADRLGSIDVGSPVFYRGIAVGEVASYTLGADDRMRIQVFVRSPYDRLIRSHTRFWNVSAIEVTMGSDGLKAQMESLLSFMQGGLAFENLKQLDQDMPVAVGHVFTLYPNKDSISQQQPSLTLNYVMPFVGNVSGLQAGARVEHMGLEVGRVVDVEPVFDVDQLEVRVPVLVELWPERLAMPAQKSAASALFTKMVNKGLRAKLKVSNLLTGQVVIDLSYQENPEPVVAQVSAAGYPIFPTVETDMEQLMQRVNHMISQLEKAPLQETLQSLNETAKGLKRMLNAEQPSSVLRQSEQLLIQVNETLHKIQPLPAQFSATLTQTQTTLETLNKTLTSMDHTLSEDSLVQHDVRTLMQELARAATAVETLADTLQRQPNAVIFGKE